MMMNCQYVDVNARMLISAICKVFEDDKTIKQILDDDRFIIRICKSAIEIGYPEDIKVIGRSS